MTNNYVLRRLAYALDISYSGVRELLALGGRSVDELTLAGFMKQEDEGGYLPCDDAAMESFLDGLIVQRRGKREPPPGQAAAPSPRPRPRLDNNLILKKVRIALELTADDLLDLLRAAEFQVSASELSALFRQKGNKNYRPCGDQFLRSVLTGLTRRHRGGSERPQGG